MTGGRAWWSGLLAPLLLGVAAGPTTAGAVVLDRIAALVNDEVITLSEVQEEGQPQLRKIVEEFVGREQEDRLNRAQQDLMEQLIDRRLQYQAAKKENLIPSAADVHAALEELKRQNSITTDAEFRESLARERLTVEQVRRGIEERLAIARMINRHIRSGILVRDEEIENYYATNLSKFERTPGVRIRHILFPTPPDATPEARAEARKTAEGALEGSRGGADFFAVAQTHAAGSPASAGGEMGWLKRGELAPELEGPAYGLPVGGVSDVIETGAGFHIIKVEERQAEPVAPLADVRDQIREILLDEKMRSRVREWTQELRTKARIEIKWRP